MDYVSYTIKKIPNSQIIFFLICILIPQKIHLKLCQENGDWNIYFHFLTGLVIPFENVNLMTTSLDFNVDFMYL